MFNNSPNTYNREWLALVFANRNQQYGAYKLRIDSSRHLMKAFFITSPLFIIPFLMSYAFRNGEKDEILECGMKVKDKVDIVVRDLKPQNVQQKSEMLGSAVVPKVKSVAMSAGVKVVDDNLVKQSPPKLSYFDNAVISSVTQNGEIGALIAMVHPSTTGQGGGGGLTSGNEVLEATGVYVYPEFPGGMEAWAKYLQRNLRYPTMAQTEGVQGRVFLSFIIEKDGSVSDVKVLKGAGYGFDEEAIRVVKKSPRWKAGFQNSLPVRVRYQIPIVYAMQ